MFSLIKSTASTNPFQNQESPLLNLASHNDLFGQYLALRTVENKRWPSAMSRQQVLARSAKLFFFYFLIL